MVLLLSGFLGVSFIAKGQVYETDKKVEPNNVYELLDKKESQLEGLESIYSRLSAEVLITNKLVDNLIDNTNTNTRAIAVAACENFNTVVCTGNPCAGIDGVGCACVQEDDSVSFSLC